MPFRFHCESCDVRIKVPDGSEGKKVRCPGCGQVQRVPVGAAVMDRKKQDEPKEPQEQQERQEPQEPKERKEPREPKKLTARKAAGAPKEEARSVEDADAGASVMKHDEDAHGDLKDDAPAATPGEADTQPHEHNEALLAFLADTADTAPTREVAFTAEDAPPPSVEESADEEPAPSPATEFSAIAHVQEQDARDIHTTEDEATESPSLNVDADQAPPGPDFVASDAESITESITESTTESQTEDISTSEGQHQDDLSFHEAHRPATSFDETESPAFDDALKLESPRTSDEVAMEASSPPGAIEPVMEHAAAPADEVGFEVEESSGSEAPAGEVRDLFDDFLRREELERQSEEASDEVHDSAQATGKSQTPPSLSVSASASVEQVKPVSKPGLRKPAAGEPVVVVKVPSRVVRKPSVEAASAVEPAAPVVSQQRAPQAISLSPVKVPREDVADDALPPVDGTNQATGDAEEILAAPAGAHAASQADGREALSWSAPSSEASPPVARPRRMAPPPGYATLLALCWILRVLACISLVSVVKLGLLWIDAGTKWLDVLIVAPLGLGLVVGIWAMGEIARAVRDTARNSHR